MPNSLAQFIQSQDWELLERVNGWKLVSSDDDMLTVQFPARDGQVYRVLFVCDGYPEVAPSVRFVDTEGSSTNPAAWPKGDQMFFEWVKPPQNCFICMPLTREGLAHHPDWKSDASKNPWDGTKHTLMDVFNFISSRLLQSEHYQGRGQ